MSHDFRAELARELAREELFDEGVEAARNACVGGASIASAAIVAAAYYDSPLVGIGALGALMRHLELAGGGPLGWVPALSEPQRRRCGHPPGFGHVGSSLSLAIGAAASRLCAACDCPGGSPRLAACLEHRAELARELGPLNAVGLSALWLTDHGVGQEEAERLFLCARIAPAVEQAQGARRLGLGRFPFFAEAYEYEGERPAARSFDMPRLLTELGLE